MARTCNPGGTLCAFVPDQCAHCVTVGLYAPRAISQQNKDNRYATLHQIGIGSLTTKSAMLNVLMREYNFP